MCESWKAYEGTRVVGIVNKQIRLAGAVAELYHFEFPIGPAVRIPLSRFLPKTIGLPCSSCRTCSLRASRSVSENHAPSLKMLQFCSIPRRQNPCCGRVPQRFFQVPLENVHGPGHKRSFGSDGQRNGLNGRSATKGS